MSALITVNQATLPAGVAGKSRSDGVVSQLVTCTNSTVESSYLWTLVDVPIRSALTRGTTGTGASFTFTPDVKGTYSVSLRTNGSSSPSENDSVYIAILSSALGWRYQAAGETSEDNEDYAGLGFPGNTNPRGWATNEDLILEDIEAGIAKVESAVSSFAGLAERLVETDPATGRISPTLLPGMPPSGPAGGDVSGSYSNLSVVALRGRAISNVFNPAHGDTIIWDTSGNAFRAAPGGGGGGGGGISQLSGDANAGPGTGAQAITVLQARGLLETSGPTTLTMGAVADGEYLRRSGTTVIGGSGGGGGGGLPTVLYDMPISVGSVGTPYYYRWSGDTGTPIPGTVSTSVVSWACYPNSNALRLAATGMSLGGVVWPVNHGITLPEQFILEVVFASMDALSSGRKAVVFPFCELFINSGVRTVRGLSFEFYRTLGQVEPRPVTIVSGPYSRVLSSTLGPVQGYASTPDFAAGENRVQFLVRRQLNPDIGTPARWSIRGQYLGSDSPEANYFVSGVADAHTPFNGLTLPEIGIGVFGSSGDMNVDIGRLRIFSVP